VIFTIETFKKEKCMKNKKYFIKALNKGSGGSFTASLYLNSQKVASLRSDGQFVNCVFDWKDDKSKKEFEDYIVKQPPRLTNNKVQFTEDADSFVADLLSQYERELWLKDLIKTNVVFTLKSDSEFEYNIFNEPFSEEIKQRIIKENGDNLLEILNEK